MNANGKICIGYNVIGYTEEGDREIQSVYYPFPLCDELEITENKESGEAITFSFSGFEIPGDTRDNLIWFAHHLITQHYRIPNINVHIHKNIPLRAGLGGASSDAAAFIKLVNEKFKTGLAWGELHLYARQLAADCSFFISNRPSLAEGIGNRYESIKCDLSGYHIVVIVPPITLNRRDMDENILCKMPARILEDDIVNLPIEEWRGAITNDIEDWAFAKYPQLENISKQLYEAGAIYVSLNGCGPSVYGIFRTEPELMKEFAGCFIYTGRL